MNNLKKLRQEKKLSLRQLEELTGLSHSYILRLENGERRLNDDAINKLCKALECTPIELLGFDNYTFEKAEVFDDADIEFLHTLKQLNESDREQIELFISFLIYQHKCKLHDVGGE